MKLIHIHNGVRREIELPERQGGLGNRIERAFGKISGLKRLPCHDQDGKLKPESGCAKRKAKLNELGKKIGL